MSAALLSVATGFAGAAHAQTNEDAPDAGTLEVLANSRMEAWVSSKERRAELLDGACVLWERSAEARKLEGASASYVRTLANLSTCRVYQKSWTLAYETIVLARTVASENHIVVSDVDLEAKHDRILRYIPLVTIRLTETEPLDGLKVTLGGEVVETADRTNLIVDKRSLLEVTATCRAPFVMYVQGTAGKPSIVEVPALELSEDCAPKPKREPVFLILGAGGISVGVMALMVAGGAGVYKGVINETECQAGCGAGSQAKKDDATDVQTAMWWTAGIAGGIGVVSLAIAGLNGEMGSRSRAPARTNVGLTYSKQTLGVSFGGSF